MMLFQCTLCLFKAPYKRPRLDTSAVPSIFNNDCAPPYSSSQSINNLAVNADSSFNKQFTAECNSCSMVESSSIHFADSALKHSSIVEVPVDTPMNYFDATEVSNIDQNCSAFESINEGDQGGQIKESFYIKGNYPPECLFDSILCGIRFISISIELTCACPCMLFIIIQNKSSYVIYPRQGKI